MLCLSVHGAAFSMFSKWTAGTSMYEVTSPITRFVETSSGGRIPVFSAYVSLSGAKAKVCSRIRKMRR